MPDHLGRLLEATSVVPAVNQIEVHPYFRQADLLAFDAEHGIVNQAWSPIGGITFYRDGSRGSTLQDPVIGEIASAHGKTPAQVMLRWHLQQGRQAIPKSVTPSRIAENFDVFDFELTADQLSSIDALDTGVRGGPEPEQITLETFGFEIPRSLTSNPSSHVGSHHSREEAHDAQQNVGPGPEGLRRRARVHGHVAELRPQPR
jgi:diketogulonate reductase-like aldo/keto reductase